MRQGSVQKFSGCIKEKPQSSVQFCFPMTLSKPSPIISAPVKLSLSSRHQRQCFRPMLITPPTYLCNTAKALSREAELHLRQIRGAKGQLVRGSLTRGRGWLGIRNPGGHRNPKALGGFADRRPLPSRKSEGSHGRKGNFGEPCKTCTTPPA